MTDAEIEHALTEYMRHGAHVVPKAVTDAAASNPAVADRLAQLRELRGRKRIGVVGWLTIGRLILEIVRLLRK